MSLWISDVVIAISLVIASEWAFRAGRRVTGDTTVLREQTGAAQASMLGLLALFLGFSLSMADSRFDARRKIIVAEAAAVGTTYLRAQFLPEPQRAASRQLLRDYVVERRAYYEASTDEAPDATARAHAIQGRLWALLVEVAPTHDTELIATYTESLNEMIDLETAREVTIRARVPWTIRALLLVVAIVAVGINAFATGLARIRLAWSTTVLPILVALSMTIIIDLDRARAGFITTGDLPMKVVAESMAHDGGP